MFEITEVIQSYKWYRDTEMQHGVSWCFLSFSFVVVGAQFCFLRHRARLIASFKSWPFVVLASVEIQIADHYYY